MKRFSPARSHNLRHHAAWTLAVALLLAVEAPAQESRLPRTQFRSGDQTLTAFSSVVEGVRNSVVKLNVSGETVALGAVIDANGLAITKASELKPGLLSCWLASGKEVEAQVVSVDEEYDLALVRLQAAGLKPVVWDDSAPVIGQWAITPGIVSTPHAVGVISAATRRIRHPRAYIGIQFDVGATKPIVRDVMRGLGAEQVGIKSGDVILEIAGDPMADKDAVVKALAEFRDGQKVKLIVQRDDGRLAFDVPLKTPTPGQAEFDSYSEQRLRPINGRVSQRSQGFELVIQHDSVLQPWLCGGPVINLEGKAMGINIARAGRVATYSLPASVVKRAIANLANRVPTSSPNKNGG
jgi:serine protease Do